MGLKGGYDQIIFYDNWNAIAVLNDMCKKLSLENPFLALHNLAILVAGIQNKQSTV